MDKKEINDDIINLPHHVSKKHPQMPIEERAAQFAPFAALVGYENAVEETARITTKKVEISEEEKYILNIKINMLKEQMKVQIYPKVNVIYFVPDTKKQGGRYVSISGTLEKIDEFKQLIILDDKTEIDINQILSISGESLFI